MLSALLSLAPSFFAFFTLVFPLFWLHPTLAFSLFGILWGLSPFFPHTVPALFGSSSQTLTFSRLVFQNFSGILVLDLSHQLRGVASLTLAQPAELYPCHGPGLADQNCDENEDSLPPDRDEEQPTRCPGLCLMGELLFPHHGRTT